MEKFLEVKNLRVSYHSYAGEVQSVRGVSFSYRRRTVCGHLWENPAAENPLQPRPSWV